MAQGGWSNDAIETLTIPTGATTGARIVIDGTRGAILVYNSAGQLVAAISSVSGVAADSTVYFPQIESIDPASGRTLILNSAEIDFAQAGASNVPGKILLFEGTNDQAVVLRSGTTQTGGPDQAVLSLISAGLAGQLANAQLNQEVATGSAISGCAVQNDDSSGNGTAPKFLHMGSYSGTTNGVGLMTYNHGASFTPAGGIIAPTSGAAFTQYDLHSPFSPTTGTFGARNGTGALVANTAITWFALHWA